MQITIVLLAVMLLPCFIGYATAVTEVDPKFFECKPWSPIREAEFAMGNPPVSLTHIFCGNIWQTRASGFHGRPGGRDPPTAIPENQIAIPGPIDCFNDVKIYNDRTGTWKKKNSKYKFCFFPTSWSMEKTVDVVRAIFHHCKHHLPAGGTGRICGINYKREGFDVLMHYKHASEQDKTLVVTTAWPQQTGEYTPADCTACDISHL